MQFREYLGSVRLVEELVLKTSGGKTLRGSISLLPARTVAQGLEQYSYKVFAGGSIPPCPT